jgi:hypothetical protein
MGTTEKKASRNWLVPRADRRASFGETDRLRFAKQVLVWLALMCSGIIAAYACFPHNVALAQAFELVKIGALPVLTLLLSFYFPSTVSRVER